MSPARGVNHIVVKNWSSFREREARFIHPIALAQARLAGARVEGRQTLVEKIKSAVEKHRWVVIIESVFNVIAFILRPTRRHHLDFTYFVFPDLFSGGEVKYVQKWMTLKTIVGVSFGVF